MNQTVSSTQGRNWLTNLNPASMGHLSPAGSIVGADPASQLPQTPLAETIEVQLPSRQTFQTEAIYRQLSGIDQPAVSHLEQLEIPAMNHPKPRDSNHEIVFVSIPTMGVDPLATTNLTNLAASSPTIPGKKSYDIHTIPPTVNADSPTAATGSPPVPPKIVPTHPVADKSLQATTMNASSTAPASRAPSSKFAGGEIGILVEKILDRFPLASPTILLFVGGQPDPNVESTATQVAGALGRCHVGDVLLIDGDLQRRKLSQSEGMHNQQGLSEIINRSEDWRALVADDGSGGFSFLPAGVCPSDRWNANELLRQMSAEMKQDFQFICVAAGDAHTKHAKLWCDVCDGSYLVVSMQNSNETLAKSAVAELNKCGARVLGCVVADAQ